MTPNSRRMRRTREVSSSRFDLLSGYDVYSIQGDAKAALDVYLESQKEEKATLSAEYNCLLLQQLASQSSQNQDFLKILDDFETEQSARKEEQMVSTRKRARNEFIMSYNRALVLQASGETTKCAAICNEKISAMILARQIPSDELTPVAFRMGLLLLESLLALSVGRNTGLDHERLVGSSAAAVIDWLELLDAEQDPQLKFLLSLYKSRVDLSERDDAGRHVDSKIRSARKELKSAMEVFQQKLRPTFGAETGSVVSSANSEENSTHGGGNHEHQQQQIPTSLVLQKYNQSALSLKANLEQLKGNTKKSLILCSEAQSASKNDGSYDAVHSNNLAVVYETNDKRHLALHALTKGLRANSDSALFHGDGTACPNLTLAILHNAAICALQAKQYLSAYECMAACVMRSDVFRSRPRCWLRIAEACIGRFTELRREKSTKFSTVEINGEPHGIVVDSSMLSDDIDVIREKLVEEVCSPADLEQVKKSPLLRARAALARVLGHEIGLDSDTLTGARLSLAYVCLAFRDYKQALHISKLVLETKEAAPGADKVTRRLHDRQMATARMYAAEASCALGEMVESMKYLVGDGKEDAFDRLASDLGGVTLETAAGNGKGKRRLAKAQTMVRSSACAVTAAMGNTQAAKQLANSANAMEDAYASNRERSSARRALIYALLRDGHQSPALNLLMSLRLKREL